MNPSEPLSLAGLLRVLRRRRRLILGVTAAFGIVGLAVAVLSPRVYHATMRIEFRTSPDRLPWSGQTSSSNFQSENAALYTSAELITNRVVLGQLASSMIRDDVRYADAKGDNQLRRWLGMGAARAAVRPLPVMAEYAVDPQELDQRVDQLQKTIRVEPVEGTHLVDVRVEGDQPERTRLLADQLAQLFVDYENQRLAESDTTGLAFLKHRMAEVEQHLDQVNARLARSGVLSPELQQARAEQIRSSVAGLRHDLIDAEAQLATARGIYGPEHPKLAALEFQVSALRRQLAQEEGRAAAAEMHTQPRSALESEAQVDQETYAKLLTRAREAGLDRQLSSPEVALVQPAALEPESAFVRRMLTLCTFLMAGVFVGTGGALVGESVRRTIQDADDAERQLGIPVLAEVTG